MAKEKDAPPAAPEEATSEGQAPKKKIPTKLLIIIAAVVLLLAGGGGAAWFFLGSEPAETETGEAEAPVKAPEAKTKAKGKEKDKEKDKAAKAADKNPPLFITLEPFTVNLQKEAGDRYLQVGLIFAVPDEKASDKIKLYMPVVRDRILLLLSSKGVEDLITVEGKNKLAEEIVAESLKAVPGSNTKTIQNAHYTMFVIQ